MTSVEVVSFAALWAALIALAALVVLLYRELDRAYARPEAGEMARGLPPDSPIPPLLVVKPDGSEELRLGERKALALLAILSTECEACERTMTVLQEWAATMPVWALIAGTGGKFQSIETPGLELYSVHNPADVAHKFLVNLVPTVFLVHGGKVRGHTGDGSSEGIKRIFEHATGDVVGGGQYAEASLRTFEPKERL